MKIRSICRVSLIIFFLGTQQSHAQYKLADPVPQDPDVKTGKLGNGLRYYIRKNLKPEKKLELRLVVNAGSILEKNDQQGLAHFMEHMNFNGTKHFPKNDLVDYLQKSGVEFGADLNAYTGFDETVYILPIPTDDSMVVEKGFTVLEDWAFNNLFDESEINKERGVVLEESRLNKNAEDRMSRQYFPKLFNGSKYAQRLPIGKDSILKTFKPQALINFNKSWYRPDLIAVIVVGDIDPAIAEEKIIAHFSGYKNPAGEQPRPSLTQIPARLKPEAMVVTDSEATNTFLQVYNFVKPEKEIKTWSDYREDLKQSIVSSLISQRLAELTQKENPPFVYGATAFAEFLRGYISFNSFALIGQGTVQEALDALIAETNRARQYGFLQSELDRVKASFLNNAEKNFNEKDKTESGRIISQYVNNFLDKTPVPGAEHRYKFLKQILPDITLSEVNTLAKSMPSVDHAFTLVEAPANAREKLPRNAILLSGMMAAAQKPVTPYQEKQVAASLLDKDPVAGHTTGISKNDKLGTTDLTLSNGVTITIKPTQLKNDEIKMDAWRMGGYHKFELADKDNARHAADLVQAMGVKDMKPTDLKKFLAGKTLSVSPYINMDEDGIEATSSVKDLKTCLQLLHLYFTQPRKDDTLFHSYVTKNISRIQFIKQNPQAWFADTVNRILYNDNPWAESGLPSVEEYSNLNLDRSFSIYNRVFGNAWGLHFTFVGNIDPDKDKPLLEKYIGSLPAQQQENICADKGVRILQGKTIANLKKGMAPQSIILVSWEGEAQYNRNERLHLAALIDALNIKIIDVLREKMSGIYGGGIFGSITKRPYVHFSIGGYLPCGPENVDTLTKTLIGLIRNVQDSGMGQKELDKVKETWKKQYHVNLQTNDYWLSILSDAWINGDNPEDVFDYEQKVDAITVQDLQDAAKKYFTLNNMAISVLYPERFNIKQEVRTTKGF